MARLSFYKCTGTGYENGWWTNNRSRYRCFAGARNTKKSYNIMGLEILQKIIMCPLRNILVLRQVGASIRQSAFANLVNLINQPDISNTDISFSEYFHINSTSMTITYKPTGQVIIFDGLLKPTKINSIKMKYGYLTDVYVEEAFELPRYEDFRKIDGSVRGMLPEGYFFQITFCFNTWNKNHWLYEKFFKGRLEDDLNYLLENPYQDFQDDDYIGDYGKGLYLHKSTYKVNEFRTPEYDESMENMRRIAPEIFKVEALGMWGNSTASTYPEFNDILIKHISELLTYQYQSYTIGIDTGYSNGEGKVKKGDVDRFKSATTMQLSGYTSNYEKIVALDEYFHSNEGLLVKKTQPEMQEEIIDTLFAWQKKYASHPIIMKGTALVYVDCADIGFRDGLTMLAKKRGLFGVQFIGSSKNVRIQTRVDFIRLMMAWGEYLVSTNCPNLIREIKNARQSEDGFCREDFDDHCINANEYAWIPVLPRVKRFKDFKPR